MCALLLYYHWCDAKGIFSVRLITIFLPIKCMHVGSVIFKRCEGRKNRSVEGKLKEIILLILKLNSMANQSRLHVLHKLYLKLN